MKKFLSLIACAVIAITASAAVGDVFTYGKYFNFQITKESTNSARGKVKLVSLTDAGKNVDGLYGSTAVPGSVLYNNKNYDVDAVGAHVFSGIESHSIEFGYGLTTIESYAFDCNIIVWVHLPSSVKTINANAFNNCSSLTTLCMSSPTPPNTHANAFGGREKNINLFLANNGANIVPLYKAHSVYGACKSVTKVYDFGDNYIYLYDVNNKHVLDLACVISENAQGERVFSICGAKELSDASSNYEVVAPAISAASAINDSSFINLTKVKKLDLSNFNFIKTVGKLAFKGVPATELRLPNSVETIGYAAFYGCKNLKEIIVPEMCNDVSVSFVDGCTSLADIYVDEGNKTYACYQGKNYLGILQPGTMLYNKDGSKLIRCPEGAPSNACIYSDAKTIGSWAFDKCLNLTNFHLPYGLQNINGNAFANCSNLLTVYIPSSVKEIGNSAFNYCSSLQNVYLTAYDAPTCYENTFPSNENMRLYYPNCTGYAKTSYSSKTGYSKFSSFNATNNIFDFVDTNLNYYVVRTQPKNGVYGEAILVKMDETLQSYMPVIYAFNNRMETSGENYKFYLTRIANSACEGIYGVTPALKTLDLYAATHLVEIGEFSFMNCTNLTSVKLNEELTVIRSGAFYGCNKITELTIPDKVELIAANAFRGCNGLKKLTIGRSVRNIGNYAFDISTSGMDIYSRIEGVHDRVTMGTNVFANTNKNNSTLYVPKGYRSNYEQTDQWKEFWDVKEIDYGFNDAKKGDVNGDGNVDVADMNLVIDMILGNVAKTAYDGRGDVTGDGNVDVADVNAIINIILGL